MIRNQYVAALAVLSGLTLTGNAQPNPAVAAADTAARDRIAALSVPLHWRVDEPGDPTARDSAMRMATDKIRDVVDAYVRRSLTAAEGSARLQARLRTVLEGHQPNPQYDDLPFVKVADLRDGRSMVVAYTLVRGAHHNIGTVRGYRWDQDHFSLVGTTGDDFADYGMFKAELQSPTPGEFWMLVWGQAHSFNGKKVRCRVYAFDGRTFRTMWAPEDMFNANIEIAGGGFSIEHEVRPQHTVVREEYRLTLTGPVRTK